MTDSPAFAGRHVLAELRGVAPELLDDEAFLRSVLVHALVGAGATICDVVSKHFEPQGVTALVLLSESHASIHTYPEHGAAFIDVFTCGERASPERAVALLVDALQPLEERTTLVHRGGDAAAQPKEPPCPPFMSPSLPASPAYGSYTTSSMTASRPISTS